MRHAPGPPDEFDAIAAIDGVSPLCHTPALAPVVAVPGSDEPITCSWCCSRLTELAQWANRLHTAGYLVVPKHREDMRPAWVRRIESDGTARVG